MQKSRVRKGCVTEQKETLSREGLRHSFNQIQPRKASLMCHSRINAVTAVGICAVIAAASRCDRFPFNYLRLKYDRAPLFQLAPHGSGAHWQRREDRGLGRD
ncbi:hypothetical protein AAFF_G00008780 [Aldrovandia affinis]|uniref:Uncharacterized protein n=1 Tax=Aldrovandia affinis TaxID=143900 RepID=A0AAD7T6D3_9TELE|nr:hypothetical protein AAFF_G00008780 [Aldrovandia affinis]